MAGFGIPTSNNPLVVINMNSVFFEHLTNQHKLFGAEVTEGMGLVSFVHKAEVALLALGVPTEGIGDDFFHVQNLGTTPQAEFSQRSVQMRHT